MRLLAPLNAAPSRITNNQIGVIGDSIGNHNSLIASGSKRFMAYGYLPWAAYLSNQRVEFQPEWNEGIPGSNTDDVVARIDAYLRSNTCGTIIIDCLTNDGPNGLTVAKSKANYLTLIRKIQNAGGRRVILMAPRPRDITASGLTLTATLAKAHIQRRDFVLGLHNPAAGIYVVNTWDTLVDPLSANMAMIAGVSYDGLHPNQLGGYYDGLALANLFGMGTEDEGLFPYVDVLSSSALDVYDAVNMPGGALNTNPIMAGGTTNATGYIAINGQGITSTLSKVVVGNRTWQQSVLSGTVTGTSLIWPVAQNPVPSGNLTIGDVVEGFCDFEMDAGLTGITGLGLALMDNTSFARAMAFDSTTEINTSTMPNVAHKGVMRTPKFTLTSTGIRFGIACSGVNTATAAATFRVGSMKLRKVGN